MRFYECAKDLISSEAKFHALCYKSFVKISYLRNPDGSENCSSNELLSVYDTIFSFYEALIDNPRIVELKEIRKLVTDEATRLGINIPNSRSNNLIRKHSSMFEELHFVSYQDNKMLVYPCTFNMETVVLYNYISYKVNKFFMLKSRRQRMGSCGSKSFT